MEQAPVQPTRHWAIADYFQRTFEDLLILRRVLRSRHICDIYDLFAPFINLLTYLLTKTDEHKYNNLILQRPMLPYGTAIKHPVPDRVKPSFVIVDIRAL